MKCPKCEKDISPEFNVCPWCGYKPKKCSNPEHQDVWLPEDARFCPRCGEPLSGDLNKNLEFAVEGVSFTMVYVEGGTFMMGAQAYDEDGENYDSTACDEDGPVHKVTLSDFHIGETQVTQELWMAVMNDNPSECEGSDHPVDNVSWNDCQSFIKKLNHKLRDQLPQGYKFCLPSEAQWEFAARGGNMSVGYIYSGSDDIDDVAWYEENCDKTHPVMKKDANELGLYDMSGNVSEWCQDRYGVYEDKNQDNPKGSSSGNCRVCRGGSWNDNDFFCRVGCRNWYDPDEAYGFRLVLDHL